MPSAVPTVSIRSKWRRFCRNRRGSAAIEFALIAPVFFALLFAIIETGIVFFAGQVLETGVQDAGRQLYTHQLQDKGLSAAQAKAEFRKDLFGRVSALLSCQPDMAVVVRLYAPGDTNVIYDPIA